MSKPIITMEEILEDIRKDCEQSKSGLGSYFDWVADNIHHQPTHEEIKAQMERDRKQFEDMEKELGI